MAFQERIQTAGPTTYRLILFVSSPLQVRAGGLGVIRLPAGWYVYTGSARRNMEPRIARHLRRDKRRRWHIDYLTGHPGVVAVSVTRHEEPECVVNRRQGGQVVVPGFGAADCRNRCGSHLRYLGRAL